MVAHILKRHGERVGLATTDGIYIDGQLTIAGDLTGPWSPRTVLQDTTIDSAVLETARGGILREGLGFDRCDVGAVLNVSNDHLGYRGIETVEQMANVKSRIIEVVRDDGSAVLNADDELVAGMSGRARGRIVYWSMWRDPAARQRVEAHIARGGAAVIVQPDAAGEIVIVRDAWRDMALFRAYEIPASLLGRARHNLANALAAAAITFARGVTLEHIRQGLLTFTTSYQQIPGRLNVFDGHPFRVILDYGHNPPAFAAMCELIQQLRAEHSRIIGVVSVPGDRRDCDIHDMGAIAGRMFDLLMLKEDSDLRGRRPGELSGMLGAAAIGAGLPAERIVTIPDESAAIGLAFRQANPNDLIVIFARPEVWAHIVAPIQAAHV
jgi:cyanophycin synthetase